MGKIIDFRERQQADCGKGVTLNNSETKPTPLTPILKEWFRVKAIHKDALVLLRCGDFYEIFFEDAKIAREVLNLKETAPLCGFPYFYLSEMAAKLVGAGNEIVICEPADHEKYGYTKQNISRVVSPSGS